MRIVVLTLLISPATAQQSGHKPLESPIPEPELPVIGFDGGCTGPSCWTNEEAITKRSTLYETWRKDSKTVGEVAEGEVVWKNGTICVTYKPDRLVVKTAIPDFRLKVGDVVLRYVEQGRGSYDVKHDQRSYDIWANGGWYRDTNWSQADDGGEILCTEEESAQATCRLKKTNSMLVEPGIREWWRRIEKRDHTKGWIREQVSLNSDHASADTGHDAQDKVTSSMYNVLEPKLPVIDNDACPGRDRSVADYRIARSHGMYSSYREGRTLVTTLKARERVTILAGVNVIRKPDRASIRQPHDGVLQSGDVALGYGFRANGNMDFWAKGVWFEDSLESIIDKGGECGFRDKTQCDIEIIENGIREWWVQVKTGNGAVGWVRADSSDTFSNLCTYD